MRKPIQIKGISTTSSYEDGECLDMMNVRHEQGVLKPVEVFPTDFTLKNVYSLLYWHKNNSYTHLIGVRNNNVYWIKDKVTEIITNKEYTIVNAVYIDGKTTFQLSQSIAPDLNIGDKLISIDGIPKEQNLIVNINNYSDEISFDGNLTNDYYPGAPIIIGMVSFQTEMMADEVWLLQLAINKNVVISHIGNLINVLDGEVLKYIFWQDDKYLVINTDFDGAQTDTSIGPIGKIDLKVDGVVDGSARKTLNFYSDVDVTVGSPYDDKQKLAGGLLLKAKAYDDSKGRLTGFILACTAIELYDGNFILQSNPVLLGQAFDEKTRYTSTNISGHDYIDNPALYYSPGAVAWDDVASNEEKFYEKISDTIITGTSPLDDVLTSYFPNAFCSSYFIKIDGGSTVKKIVCRKSSNALKIKITKTISEQYRSLIKSVSVFISPQVLAQDYETLEYKGYFDYNGVSANRSENYFAKPKSNADILKELAENQRFYKVHEIQFDDIKTTTENDGWVAIDLKGKLGDNLLVQPELKTESFSNIKARNQMTYNSMLHAWDIKNVIGRGWPMNYFYPNIGIGQFEAIGQSEVEEQGWRESIEVKIKTDVGVSSVVRITPELQGEYLKLFNLSPMLSYPDARATEMVIYRSYFDVSEGRYLELKDTFRLTASDTGSFAYYISPNLKPIILISERYEDNQTDIPSESNQELSYQNKLKVSNTNNPFLFPDTQTYQIGDGSILNVASQSIRTSDGQFGQFPLICFCTDGVFSLEVGDGTVAYSRQVKPQSYERPISKVICTTPFGILFISNRGLCMVAGQDVIYLSETMFEKFRNITLELPTSIASSFSFDTGLFNDYLKDCSAMVYNPKEQEVIIINPNKEFNYVYNFSTKQFYKNDEQITNEINNSLPSLQVWKGLLVKNVTRTEAGQRKITFTTRPIKMQTTDFKRFERVILRGYLSQLSGAVACIWGSIDDRNFKLLRGITLTDNTTRKDLDFGMFGKTTYRSYIIGLSMTVGTDSEIEAIEMEIEKLYNNTNMQ